MDDFKSELLKVFVGQILPVLITGLIGVVGAFFTFLTIKIKGAAEAQKQNMIVTTGLNVLARATEMMRSVVAHVNVELAEPIRAASEDGVITAEEAKVLKEKALELFKKSFGEAGLAELKSVLGDGVGTWLSGLLERVLIDQKAIAGSVLPAPTEPVPETPASP